MKILQVGDIAFVGSRLCHELRDRGIETDLISKNIYGSKEHGVKGVYYPNGVCDALRLCGLDLSEYNIIHSHYLINWTALGVRARNRQTPVILHCHGCDTRPATIVHKMIQRYVAQGSGTLLFSTPDLMGNIDWFEGERIYLPNPVAVPSSIDSPEKYKDRALIFTTMYRVKRTEAIFPIIKNVKMRFDIIDSGPDATYYKRIAPANVHFIKPFSRATVFREISKYPFIIGGSQDGTMRVSELESMSLGIPTIFPFQYNHFYPEPLPTAPLSYVTIEKLLVDGQLGLRQREWVQKYHDVRVVVDRLLKIYQRFLEE